MRGTKQRRKTEIGEKVYDQTMPEIDLKSPASKLSKRLYFLVRSQYDRCQNKQWRQDIAEKAPKRAIGQETLAECVVPCEQRAKEIYFIQEKNTYEKPR